MTRRSIIGVVGLGLALAFAVPATAQTVDELVAKNLEAKGGIEKLKAIQSMKETAKLMLGGTESTLLVYGKRPNLLRQEHRVQGQTVIMAFDGSRAWMINPLVGSSQAVLVMGPQADAIREQSQFDGPLVDYKARGYKIEYVGLETSNGRRLQHLRMLDRSQQASHLYLDAETGLEAKLVTQTERGSVDQEFADYRDVQGIRFPFEIRTTTNGVLQSVLTVEKVEFNLKLDDNLFKAK